MRCRRGLHLAFVAAVFAASQPVAAHHSTAFYADEFVELEGELVRVDWINPHVRFVLLTTDAGGAAKLYQMEASAISALERRGVTRDLFKTGERVKIAGHASTRDPSQLQLTNVLFADGREASLWLDSSPRFKQEVIRKTESVVDAASENRGFFRVWSAPRPSPTRMSAPFTPAAVDARKSFDLLDNFATRCGPQGMPAVMIAPLPVELVDRGNEIQVRAEVYDTVRTIHMDRSAPPAGTAPSILGYSVGKWDNGALVVKTTLIDWPYFDSIGTPQSKDVAIDERYTLSPDQTRLDVHFTITDPANLSGPAAVDSHWLALGATLQRFDCQAPRP
jgi:uncharacterized protein DUF6152